MATLTETPRLRRVIRAQRFNFEESLEQETFLNDSNNNETPQRKRITTPRDLLYDCDNFNFSFEQQVCLFSEFTCYSLHSVLVIVVYDFLWSFSMFLDFLMVIVMYTLNIV